MRKVPVPWALALLCLAPSSAHAGDGATLRAMIEVTRIDSPSISPDGKLAVWRQTSAVIDRNDYALDWYIAPVDGSAPAKRLVDAGEATWLNGWLLANRPMWTPDSRALVFRKLAEGQIQVWRAKADGSAVRQLTHEPGNVRDLLALGGGSQLAVMVGPSRTAIVAAEQTEYGRGTMIDAAVDPQRPLAQGDWIDGRWASGRLRGFWFEQGGVLPAEPPALRMLDPDLGTMRDATDDETRLYAPPAKGFDKLGDKFVIDRVPAGDARGIALVLGQGKNYELAVASIEGTARARCTDATCTGTPIRSVAWLGTRNALVFETRDKHGRTVLSQWDIASGNVRALVTAEGSLNGGDDGQGCATSATMLLCVAAGPNEPPKVVAIPAVDGAGPTGDGQRVLAAPNHALETIGPHFEPLAWSDARGHTFNGFLAMPKNRVGPVPLFINYYSCGGFLRGGLGDEYPLRDLARAGIAALCINRYPGEMGVGGNIEAYRIAADGIAAVIDNLAREGRIDRTHVGMGGVSFGGEVAVWLAMHRSLLRAVSVANVMVTPSYYWLNAVQGREVPMVLKAGWGLGHPDTDRKGWRLVSPAFNADRIVAPLLMQLPEHEYRPNVELLARLQAAGKAVELWAFPGEMHIKWQPRHQLAANERNLDWFRFWLTGQVDPDPAKAEQYARWRSLGTDERVRQH